VRRLDVANEGADVAGDGPQLGGRGLRTGARSQDPLAPRERAQSLYPAPPAQLRNGHRDQRNEESERHEQVEQVAPGLGAPPLGEAQVVHDDQRADAPGVGTEGHRSHAQFALRAGQPARRRARESRDVRAVDAPRHGDGCEHARLHRRAIAHGKKPLVLREAGEVLRDARGRSAPQQVREGILRAVRDEGRTRVDVALEPAVHQAVDEWREHPGEQREGKQQRNDETKGESHGLGGGGGDRRRIRTRDPPTSSVCETRWRLHRTTVCRVSRALRCADDRDRGCVARDRRTNDIAPR
jgi:hypothetical protein